MYKGVKLNIGQEVRISEGRLTKTSEVCGLIQKMKELKGKTVKINAQISDEVYSAGPMDNWFNWHIEDLELLEVEYIKINKEKILLDPSNLVI